ncbi:MAG: hypothetical protein DVB26_05715 [Verrucomicrobia bacterium]|nr:MAG: hypothetical protein DVB26_05715 [Verrucomicrobiota bacterium]
MTSCSFTILTAVLLAPLAIYGADVAPAPDLAQTQLRHRTAHWKYPAPPPVLVNITSSEWYKKGTHGSVADPKLQAKREEMIRPVKQFWKQTSEMSDWYVADGDAKAAACAISWLRSWADGGGVLGKLISLQGDGTPGGKAAEHILGVFLVDVGFTWIKLQAAASPEDQAAINTWLRKIAARVRDCAHAIKPETRNNIYYGYGLGMMAAGVGTKDPSYIAEAAKVYDFALSAIRDDGTLPREMSREIKALTYHNRASWQLIMMAELARLQGLDWFGHQKSRLSLLVNRVVEGIKDPSFFNAKSGHKQSPVHHPCWLLYWQKQTTRPADVDAVLKTLALDDFSDPDYGGNVQVMVEKNFFEPKTRR